MDLNNIQNELYKVQEFIIRQCGELLASKSMPWTQERMGRCRACGYKDFLFLTVRKDLHASAGNLKDGKLFEIVDGFCLNCRADYVWPWLCRHDPTRDPTLADATRVRRRNGLCDHCLEPKVQGIWRNGVCTAGECLACHKLFLPASLARVRRRALASASRLRRFLNARLRLLTKLQVAAAASSRFGAKTPDDKLK